MAKRVNFKPADVVYLSPEWWSWYNEVNKDHRREYRRTWNKQRFITHSKFENAKRNEFKKKNPIKLRSWQVFSYAVKQGHLLKQSCTICGDTKVNGHHDYYGRPLDVLWLCPVHHSAHHRYLKSINHRSDNLTIAELEVLFKVPLSVQAKGGNIPPKLI